MTMPSDRDARRFRGRGALAAAAALCIAASGCGGGGPAATENGPAAPRRDAPEVSPTPSPAAVDVSPPRTSEAPADPSRPPRADGDVASEEVLRAADALLASCKDRGKRLVEEKDWARMRRAEHLEIATGAASAKGGPRRWTRVLVPVGAAVEAYVYDGDDYFSAYLDGAAEARAALVKLLGR